MQAQDRQPDKQQEAATELALRAVLHYSSWPRTDRRCFCLLTPSRLSAFVNSCCGVRLHLITSRGVGGGGSAVPEVPTGQLSPRLQQGSVRGHVSSVCFPFPLCFLGPQSPLVLPPQTVQLGHFHTYSIPPQESLLYIKQTFLLPNANRIHSGILQLVLCFCLCLWGCNY